MYMYTCKLARKDRKQNPYVNVIPAVRIQHMPKMTTSTVRYNETKIKNKILTALVFSHRTMQFQKS